MGEGKHTRGEGVREWKKIANKGHGEEWLDVLGRHILIRRATISFKGTLGSSRWGGGGGINVREDYQYANLLLLQLSLSPPFIFNFLVCYSFQESRGRGSSFIKSSSHFASESSYWFSTHDCWKLEFLHEEGFFSGCAPYLFKYDYLHFRASWGEKITVNFAITAVHRIRSRPPPGPCLWLQDRQGPWSGINLFLLVTQCPIFGPQAYWRTTNFLVRIILPIKI